MTEDKQKSKSGMMKVLSWVCSKAQRIGPTRGVVAAANRIGIREDTGIELYVIFKTLLPIIFLVFGIGFSSRIRWPVILLGAFAFETIAHLFIILVVHEAKTDDRFSPGRTLILLLMNFVQLNVTFAVVYSVFGLIKDVESRFQSLYFAVVTSATVGYGDMTPICTAGEVVVMVQIVFMVAFLVLFIGTIVSRLGDSDQPPQDASRGDCNRRAAGDAQPQPPGGG